MKERTVTFYIHKDKRTDNNYIYANFNASDGRLRMSTSLEGSTLNNLPKPKKNTLSRIVTGIDKHLADCSLAEKPVLKKNIEAIILSVTGRREHIKGLSVSGLVERFMMEAKKGTVRTKKGDVYAANTIKFTKHLLNKLNKDILASIPIADLTKKDMEAFSVRLMNSDRYGDKNKGKSAKNGTASYVNQLVAIISRSLDLGWHTNGLSKSANLTHPVEIVDYPIYYSISELEALYANRYDNLDFERIRDVFIFGCFTCLRHSDYYRTNYKNAVQGNELIIELKKRKNRVSIPLHPVAMQILEKYNYVLPKVAMGKFNDYKRGIRAVCEAAGFKGLELFTRTEGGVRVEKYKEKWELTTSHTMRRSFATNALKMGLKEWVVMAIGGWRSEASFKKYKRMSEEDVNQAAVGSEFYRVTM